MIVRRHMVFMAADRISQAVIADIYHNKEIASADRFAQTAFGFSGAETWAGAVDKIRILCVILKIHIVSVLGIGRFTKITR